MDLRVGKNYQLIKKIGSGAFGDIYEGRHTQTKETVAIKLVSCFSANLGHRNRLRPSFRSSSTSTSSISCFAGVQGSPMFIGTVSKVTTNVW